MTNLFKSSDDLFNEYSNPIIKWKGKTFQQISAGIRFNKTDYSSNIISGKTLFKALPLKIYRKEIASQNENNCNPRTSLKIDGFDQPGGTVMCQNPVIKGLATTIDFNYENNSCEHPSKTSTTLPSCNILSPDLNAKRRVRSSGMIPRKFNSAANNDTYCTNTNQYLVSRNRSFQQNQYFHIRQGDANVKPGTNLSTQNIYSSNGINHCAKFTFQTDASFQYQWFDTTTHTVIIAAGSYDINDFNAILQSTMKSNYHFYTQNQQKNIVFLLNLTYNTSYNSIELQSLISNDTIFNTTNYSIPFGATWTTPLMTDLSNNPVIIIPNNSRLSSGLGFASGTYPPTITQTSNQYILGSKNPGLQPSYVPIYYKPNNSQFGTQGAVSAGDLITRKKYDTITSVASSFRSAYGNQTADALAYGVSQYGYTIKDRIGYPTKVTPTFSKYSNVLSKCSLRKISNEI
jgi:hypothetical protein